MIRYAYLDCETVSLTPGPFTIWELAVIIRDEQHDREMAWHIRPDLAKADPGALKVGGFYERSTTQGYEAGQGKLTCDSGDDQFDSLIQDGPALARDIAQRLSGAVIVGANAGSFDVPHLDAYLRACGECLAADYHYIDIGSLTIGWARGAGYTPEVPLKLNQAIRLAGLDPGSYEAHTALGDARAVRDIWDAVMS